MFNAVVSFDGGQWQFMFKEEHGAHSIINTLSELQKDNRAGLLVHLVDDFGAEAVFSAAHIRAVIIEDLSKSGEAQIERSMVNARNQAKFQNKAQGDTLVRMMQPMAQPNGPFMRS